jgi:hypothetical protein
MDDAGVDALRQEIKYMYGCDSTWVESVAVREERDGRVLWDGQVQRFALVGHPRATECFAWSHTPEGKPRRLHVVLRAPPVDGPEAAVRTALRADARRTET